ncbi:hypothetical protein HF576_16440 [Microbacterium sp. CFH 90308]|uniref:Uncharacterized protein n=1 Tax=Microbacterium salsuginis TaxID=2722803 RepID=A0ABX1KEG6_9MICO|nr:hypothetical protein [Microbacterium sp. CFH 90308]NLP85437.1 hypothetical protein [Microbacterium sp. CFH 90308]
MAIIPTIETDDETTTLDYSRGLVYALLTKYADESFWRIEIQLSSTGLTTREEQVEAAHTVIAATNDLINRNTKGQA